jgi:hypothetical protein
MVASGVSVGGCIRDDPIVGSRRNSQTQTPNQWVQSEGSTSLKESQEVSWADVGYLNCLLLRPW